jgi:glycosyltransferase involved in cell wall biosynthesis
MTATYSLPLSRIFSVRLRSPEVDPTAISVVVPTYQDWDGLRITLDSLSALTTPPRNIYVANDNDDDDHTPDWLNAYDSVTLVDYAKNRGPAFARNAGFGLREREPMMIGRTIVGLGQGMDYYETPRLTDRFEDRRLQISKDRYGRRIMQFQCDTPWFYFTDCGCEHDPNLFEIFSEARQSEGDSTVAICGKTSGKGDGRINRYMSSQGILNPPMEDFRYGKKVAQSVITANVLIYGLAFSYLSGFRVDFAEAAGEDLDLGIRLREIGFIAYDERAQVMHEFPEDMGVFRDRFQRYGRGNRRLELMHNLPSLKGHHFEAEETEFQDIANEQVENFNIGYTQIESQADVTGVLYES